MLKGRIEKLKVMPRKICAECGQKKNEHSESYLTECDRCLSKKALNKTKLKKQ